MAKLIFPAREGQEMSGKFILKFEWRHLFSVSTKKFDTKKLYNSSQEGISGWLKLYGFSVWNFLVEFENRGPGWTKKLNFEPANFRLNLNLVFNKFLSRYMWHMFNCLLNDLIWIKIFKKFNLKNKFLGKFNFFTIIFTWKFLKELCFYLMCTTYTPNMNFLWVLDIRPRIAISL